MANLGFIGLGNLGGQIALRLIDAGHTLTVWNRTTSKANAHVAKGATLAATPRAVAEAADITFTMVRDSAVLTEIVTSEEGTLGAMTAGKIHIDMTTGSPDVIQHLAAKIAATGGQMLDAPVSGSVITLKQNKMSVMVSGDEATYEQVRPILLDIGPTVSYVGASGQAMAVKIATNISVPVQILALAEGALLAERYGVPREKAVEIMLSGAIASPAMKYRGPFIVEMPDYDPDNPTWFDVDMMQKDLLLALEMGRELGMPLPTTSITSELLTAARGLGLADKDFAILHKVLEHMSSSDE